MQKKVAILMGSDSDLSIVKGAITVLKGFGIPMEVHVMSAHRTPKVASAFAETARENGFAVIIAAAGKAAHLAGVIASHTTLPVIGLPCKSTTMDGLDSLLSTVQMPKGIPVATVAIDGAENAGILAAQIIGLFDEAVAEKLVKAKAAMVLDVMEKDEKLQTEMWWKM